MKRARWIALLSALALATAAHGQAYAGHVYDCVPEGGGWNRCVGEEGQDIDCRTVSGQLFCIYHQSFPY